MENFETRRNVVSIIDCLWKTCDYKKYLLLSWHGFDNENDNTNENDNENENENANDEDNNNDNDNTNQNDEENGNMNDLIMPLNNLFYNIVLKL